MTRFGRSGRRRLVTTAIAFATVGIAARTGAANAAPTFDVDGYSACTETAVPGPDENLDVVVTNCCVQHAGIPADTRYGVGCVAAVDNPTEDYRPTIVLPTRPVPPDDGDAALNGLIDLPVPLPFDEAAPQG